MLVDKERRGVHAHKRLTVKVLGRVGHRADANYGTGRARSPPRQKEPDKASCSRCHLRSAPEHRAWEPPPHPARETEARPGETACPWSRGPWPWSSSARTGQGAPGPDGPLSLCTTYMSTSLLSAQNQNRQLARFKGSFSSSGAYLAGTQAARDVSQAQRVEPGRAGARWALWLPPLHLALPAGPGADRMGALSTPGPAAEVLALRELGWQSFQTRGTVLAGTGHPEFPQALHQGFHSMEKKSPIGTARRSPRVLGSWGR